MFQPPPEKLFTQTFLPREDCCCLSLTLSLPRLSYDDLVFSVFPSIFFKLSYNINLLKNGFVTLFLNRFLISQKITLNSSRIARCTICALTFRFYYPKRVKKTKSPVAEDIVGNKFLDQERAD